MIELFLSTDGKHTVHVTANTPEEMATLAPKAKALYKKVLEEFGTKAQMWQWLKNSQSNGQATGKRSGTVEHARKTTIPRCVVHQDVPMVKRQGRNGAFWSCAVPKPDGGLCRITQGVYHTGNTRPVAA